MKPRQAFIPGASAEQLQQRAAAVAAAGPLLVQDARRNRLAKDPRAKRCFADLVNPFASRMVALDTALADAVISSAELPHLPSSLPRYQG